jgi:hypothetical protein
MKMQRNAAEEISRQLNRECKRLAGLEDNQRRPAHPLRKPAVYRSVGIKIPGNDSLMMVHVKEY